MIVIGHQWRSDSSLLCGESFPLRPVPEGTIENVACIEFYPLTSRRGGSFPEQ